MNRHISPPFRTSSTHGHPDLIEKIKVVEISAAVANKTPLLFICPVPLSLLYEQARCIPILVPIFGRLP